MYTQMRPLGESLRIMWPYCGLQMASPDQQYLLRGKTKKVFYLIVEQRAKRKKEERKKRKKGNVT